MPIVNFETSDVDWCEQNFVVTPYIAEFFNTLSSIPVLLFGLHGFLHIISAYIDEYSYFDHFKKILKMKRRGFDPLSDSSSSAKYHDSKKLGLVNAALHFMCTIVGAGSILFHSTLSWEGQALDELPMLWVSSLCLFAIVKIKDKSRNYEQRGVAVSTSSSTYFGLFLTFVNVAITYAYFRKGFVLFFVVYSVTVATMLTISIMYVNKNNKKQKRNDDENGKSNQIHLWQKRVLYSAGVVYVCGFLFLWVPEMIFCGNRKHTSHESIFTSLNLHAFFHLTSAVGSYSFCVFAALADNSIDEERDVGIVNEANWSSLYIPLPVVVVK